jgi:hypothetical protein
MNDRSILKVMAIAFSLIGYYSVGGFGWFLLIGANVLLLYQDYKFSSRNKFR